MIQFEYLTKASEMAKIANSGCRLENTGLRKSKRNR